MKKEGWDFSEALRYLAERAGVQLKPPTPEEQAAAEEHEELRALLEEAVLFYRHQLLNTTAGKFAFDYLRKDRNLQDEILEVFGIGYAPNSWDALLGHFASKGRTFEELSAVGLITEREDGAGSRSGFYDRFRHRVMFPIRDERGRMCGFGARILDPNDIPKFLNSPQTAIFDKGRILYGLDRARKSIRSQDRAVLVEGYMDVLALHQAGFSNAVSPMGTALTEHHLYLIKRFSRRIVLALDPDTAGDKATMRGLQIARQAMDKEQDPIFDARGLMTHEARLQADIRVTMLPEEMDPDQVVNRDPKEWEHLVESARPVVIHVMETLAIGRDLDDPKTRSEIANQVLPLIREVPSEIERDTYRQRLARLLKVDERTLLNVTQSQSNRRSVTRRRSSKEEAVVSPLSTESQALISSQVRNYSLEAHCLGVLLRRPYLLFLVDRKLQEEGLERLSPQEFQHADHQTIAQLFQQSVDQDIAEPSEFLFNNLSLPMMELADNLLAQTENLDSNEDRVLGDLIRGLLDLRMRNLKQQIDYQRYIQEVEYQQFLSDKSLVSGDFNISQYGKVMVQLDDTRRRIDIARGKYTRRQPALGVQRS